LCLFKFLVIWKWFILQLGFFVHCIMFCFKFWGYLFARCFFFSAKNHTFVNVNSCSVVAMSEEEKDAFYVVKKGDVVGIYKSLSDIQQLLTSSVCHLPTLLLSFMLHCFRLWYFSAFG